LCDVSAVCYVVLCISLCGVWCGVVPVGEISFYIHAPTKALAFFFLACLVLSHNWIFVIHILQDPFKFSCNSNANDV
jgi:hypothetical protein